MRLLLDESVPRRLKKSLPNHTVQTTVEMGWGGIKNGELLRRAASVFDAFITVDKNLPYQQIPCHIADRSYRTSRVVERIARASFAGVAARRNTRTSTSSNARACRGITMRWTGRRVKRGGASR